MCDCPISYTSLYIAGAVIFGGITVGYYTLTDLIEDLTRANRNMRIELDEAYNTVKTQSVAIEKIMNNFNSLAGENSDETINPDT